MRAVLLLSLIAASTAFGDLTTLFNVTPIPGLPGSNATHTAGINNAGSVVGFSYVQGGNTNVAHPILYDGSTHSLGGLGGTGGGASAINNSGQIVGGSDIVGDSARHAFLHDGTMHDLGTLPGEMNSLATGISNAGQVVGESSSSGLSHAFLYDGSMHDLGALPGKTYATASGINDFSQIVGWSYDFVTNGNLGGVRSCLPL